LSGICWLRTLYRMDARIDRLDRYLIHRGRDPWQDPARLDLWRRRELLVDEIIKYCRGCPCRCPERPALIVEMEAGN
jgi:hypothetical protein